MLLTRLATAGFRSATQRPALATAAAARAANYQTMFSARLWPRAQVLSKQSIRGLAFFVDSSAKNVSFANSRIGSMLRSIRAHPRANGPRGHQTRGARWENYTKANYGSQRGNRYRNNDYKPSFFDRLTPEKTVYAIIALNGAVFLVWQSAKGRANSFGDYGLLNWMVKNYTTMWVNLKEGRLWTLVTPAFSHIDPMHMFINMFVLYSFGIDLARQLTPRRFLAFYLGAAVCGNVISAVLRGIVMPISTGNHATKAQPSLGASTSIVGITTLFACLYPNATLMLFMVVPVPAWLATVGFIGWDMLNVIRSTNSKADGAGHLGGAAAGIAYYWFRLRPLIRRMR
ncbi:hypothetical protein LPJ64_001264 [Coemansia asiatica]|uniref:Peptidase S54 rhomboid domain-containing protein n=1 Tax=Coemansia asiatica TaxID=1052880 RepID=A0A9W7XLM4_9FUNG|nr:hypothetical protein LPJ64_001264 [Coemansia asiatica]